MGIWGPAIFSDDLAADVRNEYNILLGLGRDDQEAERLLIEYYDEILRGGDEEEPVFWFALALAQWKQGRLSDLVKKKALEWLERGGDLKRFDTPLHRGNIPKRKKALDDLREKLLSPMPPRKKVRKPTVHHCPWQVGSLLAYRIATNEEYLNGNPYYNKYVLLRVLQIDKYPLSQLMPSECYDDIMHIGLYGWVGDKIPDPKIVNRLEFIPIKDYFREPPPRMLEILQTAGANERVELAKTFASITGHIVEKSVMFDWIPLKKDKDKKVITLVDRDPEFERQLPTFFEEGIHSSTITHYRAFDITLTKRLDAYFGNKR